MTNFKVGDKVKCVHPGGSAWTSPEVGKVYTVDGTSFGSYEFESVQMLNLKDFQSRFYAWRFEPVTTSSVVDNLRRAVDEARAAGYTVNVDYTPPAEKVVL